MIRAFTFDYYVLIDPSATLSFVSPYVASRFGRTPMSILEPFNMSTLVDESILP